MDIYLKFLTLVDVENTFYVLLQFILVIDWFIIILFYDIIEEMNNRMFVRFDIKYSKSKNCYSFQH